jgi:hypothetical protein
MLFCNAIYLARPILIDHEFYALQAEPAVGHSLPKWAVHPMSAFPPIATELRTSLEVRFVPGRDENGQGTIARKQTVSWRHVLGSWPATTRILRGAAIQIAAAETAQHPMIRTKASR